ncbi:hypothetical protein KS2013_799 [Kangiella sediminilitoris]|uniref:Uncharacterized protein n=2 Tax=Kangiella sediminilitoris TaxID=1144748 RepID=A0A1B3B9P3_9GAMM|nr:hypothetical protein KS2013_799 [Kangiella sediminilitoris]
MKRIINAISDFIFLLTFFNGITFLFISVFIGGMAFNGEHSGGKFYLGDSGVLTEVSELVYYYSWFHGLSAVALLLLMIIVGGVNSVLNKHTRQRSRHSKLKAYDYGVATGVVVFFVMLMILITHSWLYN